MEELPTPVPAMLRLRRIRRLPLRHVLAVAALFAQIVAATGAPVISPRGAKPSAVPFPCQNHPCGCTTPEQGWAGDCCCFTLEAKLAWAEARGIKPPPHVRPAVEARKAARKAKSCCAQHEKPACCAAEDSEPPPAVEAPAIKWVAGIFAQKCRGEGPAGMFQGEPGTAPDHATELRAPRTAGERVAPRDSHAIHTSFRPPTPPPRVS